MCNCRYLMVTSPQWRIIRALLASLVSIQLSSGPARLKMSLSFLRLIFFLLLNKTSCPATIITCLRLFLWRHFLLSNKTAPNLLEKSLFPRRERVHQPIIWETFSKKQHGIKGSWTLLAFVVISRIKKLYEKSWPHSKQCDWIEVLCSSHTFFLWQYMVSSGALQ